MPEERGDAGEGRRGGASTRRHRLETSTTRSLRLPPLCSGRGHHLGRGCKKRVPPAPAATLPREDQSLPPSPTKKAAAHTPPQRPRPVVAAPVAAPPASRPPPPPATARCAPPLPTATPPPPLPLRRHTPLHAWRRPRATACNSQAALSTADSPHTPPPPRQILPTVRWEEGEGQGGGETPQASFLWPLPPSRPPVCPPARPPTQPPTGYVLDARVRACVRACKAPRGERAGVKGGGGARAAGEWREKRVWWVGVARRRGAAARWVRPP